MQCCVPLCENTSLNVSKFDRITFHGFPSEDCLRGAWLRALGQHDSHLPDSAVVCSQHFLHEDFCETESGSRQLRNGAIPSTVLVCMICLDTDSKMFPLSQYNLEKAYEKLTGHPLYEGGNLKQTLCVQCAQELRNLCTFRDKSLRARSLLMELLEKHELITVQHIKMIRSANNQPKDNLVSTILTPDPYERYIKENSDEDRKTESEKTIHITVKTECIDDSQSVDEDREMITEENAECGKVEITLDPLEYGSTPSTNTVCREEFPHELEYRAPLSMQLHGRVYAGPPSAHNVVNPLFTNCTTTGHDTRTTVKSDAVENKRAFITNSGASDKATDRKTTDIKSSVVKLYNILKHPQNANIKVESSMQSLQATTSCDSLNVHIARKDAQNRAKTTDEVAIAHNAAASILSETEPDTSGNTSRTPTFTCDFCQRAFTRKYYLVMHMMTHSGNKPYACELCSYKCASIGNLLHHMQTHTGEKPFPCKICGYQFAQKRTLQDHMQTHTGEKPFPCKVCGYQFAQKRTLQDHMMTHTGEKPYSCEICTYKSTQKKNLVRHMRTHTGEKPFPCEICGHRSTTKSSLNNHMRTHTGEKPFSCTMCEYKCIQKGNLSLHMRTHSGEKPFSCNICGFKFAQKGRLVGHMRTHSGEKPYCCEKCGYKSTSKSTLKRHVMRIHP